MIARQGWTKPATSFLSNDLSSDIKLGKSVEIDVHLGREGTLGPQSFTITFSYSLPCLTEFRLVGSFSWVKVIGIIMLSLKSKRQFKHA